MGGPGSGRKVDPLKNFMAQRTNVVDVGGIPLEIPNHSGDNSAGFVKTPVNPADIVNKAYVDAKTVDVPISFETYDAQPSRAAESNMHGGLLVLDTGSPLSTGVDIVVTKGIGKLFLVVKAGSDISGTITITGESIDRDTGASTPADTDTITVGTLTTDGSVADGNGNIKHIITDGYISNKWFTGTVTLSTTNLTLTDVDTYHLSFEQFNDVSGLTLETFDINIFTTNVNAQFDAYLHLIHKTTGDMADVHMEAELHIGTDGETAIADKYWRLRRGGLDHTFDGATDGLWIDLHYANSPAYVEDMTAKVWANKRITLN